MYEQRGNNPKSRLIFLTAIPLNSQTAGAVLTQGIVRAGHGRNGTEAGLASPLRHASGSQFSSDGTCMDGEASLLSLEALPLPAVAAPTAPCRHAKHAGRRRRSSWDSRLGFLPSSTGSSERLKVKKVNRSEDPSRVKLNSTTVFSCKISLQTSLFIYHIKSFTSCIKY